MSLWRWDSSIISLHHNVREELLKFIPWQWFGEEVTNIPLAFDMFHKELESFNAITDPEETNVHALRSFGVNRVSG
jgi:hypothetical protein